MVSKAKVLFLTAILLFANAQILLGQAAAPVADQRVKAQVRKLGPGTKVTVFLKDGTKVRGSISQVLDDSFDVTPFKQTNSNIISYRDVENVKKRGWSNGAKLGLGIGIGAVVVIVLVVSIASSESPSFGSIFPN